MKLRFLPLALFLSIASACSLIQGDGIPARPDALGTGEIVFDLPEAEQWSLPNGLMVYYYFNDELPQMRGHIYFPGGSYYNTGDLVGLAAITGSQMREGSIPGFTPDQLDKHLDMLAASVESSFSDEYGSVGFFSLSEDFEEVFDIFVKVIRTPSFSEDRLSLIKTLSLESIRRRRDRPGTMARMSAKQFVYGKGSVYSRVPTEQSIRSVSPAKLREFHKRFVQPVGAHLAITGSLPKEKVRKLIEKHLGDWESSTRGLPELPGPGIPQQPGIYVLERDFDQATVIFSQQGPPRHTDDQYSIKIYNQIFGHGGFSSRLFREIRSKQGLAYSVYGGLWPDVVAGRFQVELQTRNEQVPHAIKEVMRLISESTLAEPTSEEFIDARTAVERSFVFKFAEPDSIVDRAALLSLLGYPSDYDKLFIDHMKAVSPAGVLESAQRWVDPEKMIIVVVGGVSEEDMASAFPDTPIRQIEFETEPRILD